MWYFERKWAFFGSINIQIQRHYLINMAYLWVLRIKKVSPWTNEIHFFVFKYKIIFLDKVCVTFYPSKSCNFNLSSKPVNRVFMGDILQDQVKEVCVLVYRRSQKNRSTDISGLFVLFLELFHLSPTYQGIWPSNTNANYFDQKDIHEILCAPFGYLRYISHRVLS